MRAAFQADLAQRLSAIEALIAGLQAGRLSFEDASAALAAHLHDIKGTGRPFGVAQATELAADFERTLKTQDWQQDTAPRLMQHWATQLKALC